MSQLLKPFSASNALLFCLFPLSLGLVFVPSLRYVAIYRSIPVQARLPFLLFYRDRPYSPLLTSNFLGFFPRVVSRLHLDPSLFSPHSFRRGGATFAFDCHIPSEIIKLQGDWQSDAYLVYLELSQQQKQRACHAMASKLQSMFPA